MNKNTKSLILGMVEECNKITQYCSKAIKFGLFSHHPNDQDTNGNKILVKYYRLQGIIEALQRERLLPTYSKKYIEEIKRNSYNHHKAKNNRVER